MAEHSLAVEAYLNKMPLLIWVDICRHNAFTEDHVFLPKGVIVHHRNGDKTNNSIANLQVMAQSLHARMHGRSGGLAHLDGGIGGKGGVVCFIPKADPVV